MVSDSSLHNGSSVPVFLWDVLHSQYTAAPLGERREKMKEYEVVHEIFNQDLADGTVVYHVNTSGLLQRYTFTEI